MKELLFGTKLFDAVLCLNGELPDEKFFDVLQGIPILAADGAAIKLDEIGKSADFVIGDMDSFDASKVKHSYTPSQIIRITDQDTNDFEKALRFASDQNYKTILIAGLQGGELEHTLNNWSVLARYGKRLNLCAFDNFRYGIPVYDSLKFKVSTNETISIIPQHEITLSSKGLKWELSDESISFGLREGARNYSTGNQVELNISTGSALLFLDSRLPISPEFITV